MSAFALWLDAGSTPARPRSTPGRKAWSVPGAARRAARRNRNRWSAIPRGVHRAGIGRD